MTPLSSPGMACISVKLFKEKYSSQVALGYWLSQKMSQSLVWTVLFFMISIFAHFSNISFLRERFPNRQTLQMRKVELGLVVVVVLVIMITDYLLVIWKHTTHNKLEISWKNSVGVVNIVVVAVVLR